MHTSTEILLTRFLSEAGAAVPLMAVWAHGSLAKGDYQPGRSDLDLIAVVREPLDERRRDAVERLHRGLDGALAERLHCSYMTDGQLAEHGREHVTWAMGELFERPVTAVTRRELLTGGAGAVRTGAGRVDPAGVRRGAGRVRPGRSAGLLAGEDAGRRRWLLDEWVDLGMVTVARAAVTLRDGRLISKREALDVLGEMGAPPVVVDGIRARRYGTDGPVLSRFRRAKLARRFIRQAIVRVLG
ncbi:nucleotidyltransferase domain-containing protein [Nonomuraea ferruginea]